MNPRAKNKVSGKRGLKGKQVGGGGRTGLGRGDQKVELGGQANVRQIKSGKKESLWVLEGDMKQSFDTRKQKKIKTQGKMPGKKTGRRALSTKRTCPKVELAMKRGGLQRKREAMLFNRSSPNTRKVVQKQQGGLKAEMGKQSLAKREGNRSVKPRDKPSWWHHFFRGRDFLIKVPVKGEH